MTQKGSKRRQAPAYSSDVMALRYIGGLVLVALGVLIFMAVDLGMPFLKGLAEIAFGLTGSLAYILAAIPLWAGVLVIWSTQRRAPVRPWVFGLLALVGLCTFIMMISGSAMARLDEQGGRSWTGVIGRTYANCSVSKNGGGALGVVIGWPLWKLFPMNWLCAIILFLATAFCLLMMVNLSPRRIAELVTGQTQIRRGKKDRDQAQAEAQQIAWQQQQAVQQQQWEQQQQRQIIEQQQMYREQPVPQPVQQPYPANGGRSLSAADVQRWQEEMSARQAAASPEQAQHQSRIFGRKNPENPDQEQPLMSRIFGRKKQDNDGLVETSSAAISKALQEAAEANKRRTVNDMPVQPATRWNTADEETQQPAPARTPNPRGESRTAPENIDMYRRPQPQPTPEEAPVRQSEPRAERAARPVQPETAYAEPEDETPVRTRETRERRTARTEPAPVSRVQVPNVQQTIGDDTFRPTLKVPPAPAEHRQESFDWMPTPYNFPPITDLAMPKAAEGDTAAEDEMRSRKLEETLASFKVQARVVHVTHGPAISRFEMELATGTKVGNVAKLEKEIAYNMEATSVRIEAPIPGKSLVGVEIPNRKVATVTLREVLQSEKMQTAKSLLTVALGKDIAGTPIVCDLAKMPHMLIAGQTGSGKSVCINAIINSLLYRAGPDEVKLILVDPKVVELQCYNGIPHLLIPVVNDPHKAAAALAWAVAEMMERYDKFAERKVRNLDGFNANLKKGEKPMSRIVIIIDELADLMMVCKKDVEEYICRITQLARAAGIHLIVATQRPSVDVITGLIKANIPSRIAFKTASQVDSRTILDRNGSEQLLGWGDMLYLPTGSFAPTRVQGCFLSDEEVNRIVKHVRDANPSTYDPDILEKLEQIENGSAGDMSGADMVGGTGEIGGSDGGLFEQAVEFAISDGQISTSTLQRRLKIGYARAGRLTDEMEERGIVAAKDGSKPRKCLITREEWEEIKKNAEF
ncbi:MAG: hypothetical protein IJK06_04785 [Clostridia bacterium]|nr:hypothetical protein [Clostridia bacterium]